MPETETDSVDYAAVLSSIAEAVGSANVLTDTLERHYYSQDYYRAGMTALAVVKPPTVESLSSVVALATANGLAIFPRGGGYSYTDGYLPSTANGIVIDTLLLNKIININPQDMYVTVEAGCTWAALEQALAGTDVRPGFWGTLSGFNSTIGGTIAQDGASLGSAKFGTSSESVLSVDVVTADGSILSTGSAGQQGKSPFFRQYGPDMTGLFCCDAGALGVKARITLRLQRRRKMHYGLSFGYESFEAMSHAMAAVAQEGRVTEHFSFSAETMANFGDLSFAETLKTAFAVAKASFNWFSGLVQVANMGLAGQGFLDKAAFMSHCVIEAANQKELAGQIQLIRDVVAPYGFDLPNTVPTVIRATPFSPLDVLAPDGQRGLPVHTVLPFSRVNDLHAAMTDYLQANRSVMEELGVSVQPMFTTLGTTGFLYEPVFYWNDQPGEFHKRHTNPEVFAKSLQIPNNKKASQLVEKMRIAMIDLMHEKGGVHMQIGKAYPYFKDRTTESTILITAIKKQLDPNGLMNPGALGFDKAGVII